MDSKKIQRARRLIAGGFYTDAEILDFIENVLVERQFERILSDIENCDEINLERSDEQAVEVHCQIVDDLKRYAHGNGEMDRRIVADVIAGSLRSLAKPALAQGPVSVV